MNYAQFRQTINISEEDFYREAFFENRETIRIKKEKTAVKNLGRIFEATFVICNKKGFQGMTMRDLCQESGLSMGALYSYFSSKEKLLNTLQLVGYNLVKRILEECCQEETDTVDRLRTVIQAHLYLSEILQPWFYFSYMEAKNLNRQKRETAKEAELVTENLIADIIEQGQKEKVFKPRDHRLAASVIKAMLQDWYLKRWKYAKRGISVDRYSDFILEFVESFCLSSTNSSR
ncbi:MAG: TetR/AcrR family transcriptional regulator [Proteobacteria bacterium]|nr:TetR/AcrR family transcriptional regulator [Pseudomonadota bacterium]